MTRRALSRTLALALLLPFEACQGHESRAERLSAAAASSAELHAPDPVPSSAPLARNADAPTPLPPAVVLPAFEDPSWTRVVSQTGAYLVCWRALAGAVPRNEDFALEVWVLADGAPLPDASLSVHAWMPEHGHGMLRAPRTSARGDGSHLVEGMLLHMRGRWQLQFDVLQGNRQDSAECALEVH